jgi:hypothetical protein
MHNDKSLRAKQIGRRLTGAFALFGVLGAPLFAAAEGTDELWEVSVKMEMAGMPAMPAHSNQVCKPKGAPKEAQAAPENKDCKMTDVQRNGSKSSFKLVCTGKNSYTATGEFDYSGTDSYKGTMHMVGTMDGRDVDMTQNISGKRLGNCTYKDLGKEMMAKQQATTEQTCKQAIKEMNWVVFREDMGPMCQPYKKEFCAKVGKQADSMRTAAGFRDGNKNKDWEQRFGVCGLPTADVLKDACKDSVQKKDFDFVIDNCPVEGQAIAQEQCAGRDYTALMSGPYARICGKYGAGAREAQKSPTLNPTDAVKEGAKSALKKLLPF